MTDIRLNPALDLSPRRDAFARNRRTRVTDILDSASADYVHDGLAGEVPYRLVYRHKGEDCIMTREAFAAMPPQRRMEMEQAVLKEATFGFQYLYYGYRMDDAAAGSAPAFLRETFAFLNGEAFLSFARAITGIDAIARADAQATCYFRGHFLTVHTDRVAEQQRLVAYVLSFTKNWNPSWGGMLQFYDDAGNVSEGLLPLFNAISLFQVPQAHAVTYVTPFAEWPRFSITGWLHAA